MARLYLIDGTYELFRSFYGAPPKTDPTGREVGATAGFLRSLLAFIRDSKIGYVVCAFDHVIESFRNRLFEGYKSSLGVDPLLLAQFELAERAAHAAGVVVWPMVEYETDDALATAAARWRQSPELEQIVICSPDKDFAQCVRGRRVVCLDRRRERMLDEEGVRERFGISPGSIPDWLALVGDAADGIPGVPGWGKKSASTVLGRYPHLENIPADPSKWQLPVRGAVRLAQNLRLHQQEVFLYRDLATLRTDVDLAEQLEDLRWRGVRKVDLRQFCEELGEFSMLDRIAEDSLDTI